ncbi:MAG: hypothetical protein FJ125_17550 [Deltaproteobacteria bacterium]|nr:hypothetical protein [Deltaproteobacteria bacterium]
MAAHDDDDDLVLGPAKEVLDEREKVEPQQEQEQEQQVETPQPVPPRRQALHSLDVPQLIALFQASADSGSWNEEARAEILELILEKGGPGAVRRALGRQLATGDDRRARPPGAGGPPGGERGAGEGAGRGAEARAGAATPPLARWCWQGPRLATRPEERREQFVGQLVALVRRCAPLLRLTGVAAGVELGDGRRRRLMLAAPTGLTEDALARLLREWVDETHGSWVAGVHGVQVTGQLLLAPTTAEQGEAADVRDGDGRGAASDARGAVGDAQGAATGHGWLPAEPPDPLEPGPDAPLLRLADLRGHGHLDVELVLQGQTLLAGRSRATRPLLLELVRRVGQGLPLLYREGELPPSDIIEAGPSCHHDSHHDMHELEVETSSSGRSPP